MINRSQLGSFPQYELLAGSLNDTNNLLWLRGVKAYLNCAFNEFHGAKSRV